MKRRPLAVLYEHPDWFRPLFTELDRRGIPYEPLHAAELVFDPADATQRYSLVVNRMSPSAWTRGHAGAVFETLDYLGILEAAGANVLNGRRAYELELSKARQVALLASLGVDHPRTRVFSSGEQAPAAAAALTFPVIVKPNVGGRGAGIRSFATPEELAAAAPTLDLGIDGVGLVQEQLPAAGDAIVRVEILDSELLYAIKVRLMPG